MLKQFIEAALEAELEEHLDDEQRENGNRKNGKTSKRLKTAEGTLDIDTAISVTTLSAITDKVIPLVKEWQNRTLDAIYCIDFLDAMYYKVKEEGRIVTRCVYNILGITVEGRKENIEGNRFVDKVFKNPKTSNP